MTERIRGSVSGAQNAAPKTLTSDLTPRKTMFVVVIVVGCFAVLWPKVFYPILVGNANQHIKPSSIDKTTGCCDVISETDVNTIKIMSELCSTIVKQQDVDKSLTPKEIVTNCRKAVLETCGIDISVVMQEQVRLGQSTKQILDEVRSMNGSLCLKYNFGVAPWRLGVPHIVTVKMPPANVRQERPPHLRSEMVHPAFKERGRAIPEAIPQPQTIPSPSRPPPRIVEGRPGPIPGMRPTIGGPGHVVQATKQGSGSMGLIMPIYTVGIVIFFTYTVMKIVFKKQPDGIGGNLYPPTEPDKNFRAEVFESERSNLTPKPTRDGVASKLGDAELDQLRRRLRETELAMERIVEQMAKVPLKMQEDHLANGTAVKPQEADQASVKIMGMEMTASCESGKKWSRPDSPNLPVLSPPPEEHLPPPQEIYLEGSLPAQSQLLVADSATEAQEKSAEDASVVLAGKMTLSVISLDSSENGTDSSNVDKPKDSHRSSSNESEDFEKFETELQLQDEINEIIEEAQNISAQVEIAREKLRLTADEDEAEIILADVVSFSDEDGLSDLMTEEEFSVVDVPKNDFENKNETLLEVAAKKVSFTPSLSNQEPELEKDLLESEIKDDNEEIKEVLQQNDELELLGTEAETPEEAQVQKTVELSQENATEEEDSKLNEDEEEVEDEEYEDEDVEYDDSGNEDADDELQNLDRIESSEEPAEVLERINGNLASKNHGNIPADDEESEGTVSDEEVEVEEEIEYVDEEEEEEDNEGTDEEIINLTKANGVASPELE